MISRDVAVLSVRYGMLGLGGLYAVLLVSLWRRGSESTGAKTVRTLYGVAFYLSIGLLFSAVGFLDLRGLGSALLAASAALWAGGIYIQVSGHRMSLLPETRAGWVDFGIVVVLVSNLFPAVLLMGGHLEPGPLALLAWFGLGALLCGVLVFRVARRRLGSPISA
ncbi:hypothetical protein [Halobium salinum]|nr:hypothetical protein [Halobium salinum]